MYSTRCQYSYCKMVLHSLPKVNCIAEYIEECYLKNNYVRIATTEQYFALQKKNITLSLIK